MEVNLMNCETAGEILSTFFDGECPAEHSAQAFSHLFECKSCQSFWHDCLRIRTIADRDEIDFPRDLYLEIPHASKESRILSPLNWAIPLPRLVYVSVLVLLMAITFLSGYFIKDSLISKRAAEANPTAVPTTRVVFICAMPDVIVYPTKQNQELKRIGVKP
jgi:hypothetical protein